MSEVVTATSASVHQPTGQPLQTKSTCPYCGVGCGVVIEHDGKQITGVRGDEIHPANFGRLCTKGSNLHFTASPVVLQRQRLSHCHPRQRIKRRSVGV